MAQIDATQHKVNNDKSVDPNANAMTQQKLDELNELMDPSKLTDIQKKCIAQIVACFMANHIHRYYHYHKAVNQLNESKFELGTIEKNKDVNDTTATTKATTTTENKTNDNATLPKRKPPKMKPPKLKVPKPTLSHPKPISHPLTSNMPRNYFENDAKKSEDKSQNKEMIEMKSKSNLVEEENNGSKENDKMDENDKNDNEKKENNTSSNSQQMYSISMELENAQNYADITSGDKKWALEFYQGFCKHLEISDTQASGYVFFLEQPYVDPSPFFETLGWNYSYKLTPTKTKNENSSFPSIGGKEDKDKDKDKAHQEHGGTKVMKRIGGLFSHSRSNSRSNSRSQSLSSNDGNGDGGGSDGRQRKRRDSVELDREAINNILRIPMIMLQYNIMHYGYYDSRLRGVMKSICVYCNIPWNDDFSLRECEFGVILHVLLQKKEAKSSSSKWKRWAAIGAGGVIGGAAIALTAGLAAPAIAAGIGAIGLTTAGTFLLTTTGTATLYVLFGSAGAGFVGHKMNNLKSEISDFKFRRISQSTGLNVIIGISGWLIQDPKNYEKMLKEYMELQNSENDKEKQSNDTIGAKALDMTSKVTSFLKFGKSDDNDKSKSKTNNANTNKENDSDSNNNKNNNEKENDTTNTNEMVGAPTHELDDFWTEIFYNHLKCGHRSDCYTLQWQSKELYEVGSGLAKFAAKKAVSGTISTSAKVGLGYTTAATLITALTWPVALLSVANYIDNSWSLAFQKAKEAGRVLADALASGNHGRRPVTLIGYSLGARVIFYALDELARRHYESKAKSASQPSSQAPSRSRSRSHSLLKTDANKNFEMKEISNQTNDNIDNINNALETNNNNSKENEKKIDTQNVNTVVDSENVNSNNNDKSDKENDVESKDESKEAIDPSSIIESCILIGAPCTCDKKRWKQIRAIVSDRIVNCYSTNDWVLKFVYRTADLTTSVAGLMPVECNGIENVDLSELIQGHSEYYEKTKYIVGYLAQNGVFI